jgi:hypothetical protein
LSPLALTLALAVTVAPAAHVESLSRDDGVVLLPGVPGAPWTEELVEDLRQGLARLPAPMRRFPGGPLFLQLHPQPMPFGLGDGSDGAPEWTGGRSRFHLYAFGPSGEPHAERRPRSLEARARERLWRQRAIVHAVVARWDDSLGLSRRRAWRRLSGWIEPLERPLTLRERALNTFEGAFSRRRGQASSALDLATFAEERFVPVEALVPGVLPVDETVRCQEFSKTRVLDDLLREAKLMDAPPEPRGDCPAFDGWAELELLDHLEVLLVSASGRRPESLFGHLLLRPVHRTGKRVRGPTFETTVQIVAIVDGSGGPGYVLRGLFGGYPTVVTTSSTRDFEQEALRQEQRVVRRFRLDLDPEQARHVLERVWELERRGYVDYRFFTDNCASVLAFLLEGALPEELSLGDGWRLFATPTVTLDDLADVRQVRVGPDGSVSAHPLLVAIPGDLEPSRTVARRAQEARERAEEVVLAYAGEPFARGFEGARSAIDAERRAAWEALAGLAGEVSEPRVRSALYDWWEQTVRVERYLLDLAQNERRLREAELRPPADAADLRAEIADRQALFETEGAPAVDPVRASLDGRQEAEPALGASEQPRVTDRLLASRKRAAEAEATFRLLTDLQAGLVSTAFAELDPHGWLEREARTRRAEQETAMGEALPGSGAWRMALATGARAANGGGGVRPTVVLSGALLAEPLGERRLRGLRDDAETRILDGRLELHPRMGLPEVGRADLTLLAFRTLQREPPLMRRGPLDQLGWGFEVGLDRWPGRAWEQGAELQAGLQLILRESPRLRDHTLLGLSVGALVGWGDGNARLGAGPQLSLSHRSGLGSGPGALLVEAKYWPTLDVRSRLEQQARLEAGLSWIVGDPTRRAVILRPSVRLEAAWGERDVRSVELLLTLEPL